MVNLTFVNPETLQQTHHTKTKQSIQENKRRIPKINKMILRTKIKKKKKINERKGMSQNLGCIPRSAMFRVDSSTRQCRIVGMQRTMKVAVRQSGTLHLHQLAGHNSALIFVHLL